MKHIVSFSGGKDSTAMILHMIELGTYQIDEVINFDTGMEFPAMYKHIEKVKTIVEKAGIKFTILKPKMSFEYLLCQHSYFSKAHDKSYMGYGWASSRTRWCTDKLKKNVADTYFKRFKGESIIQYVGIACDEQYRLERDK